MSVFIFIVFKKLHVIKNNNPSKVYSEYCVIQSIKLAIDSPSFYSSRRVETAKFHYKQLCQPVISKDISGTKL